MSTRTVQQWEQGRRVPYRRIQSFLHSHRQGAGSRQTRSRIGYNGAGRNAFKPHDAPMIVGTGLKTGRASFFPQPR